MKSSNANLKKRGYITKDDIKKFENYQNDELFKLINSESAVQRSAAVNILSMRNLINDITFVKLLLARLCIEKSLYTKIEICNALEKGSIATAKEMTKYLGIIGKNQQTILPEKVSQKSSYPLPRDIIGRTLGKMNIQILPVLLDVLIGSDEIKISEVIDAIGFMLYYNQDCINEKLFKAITETMNKYIENNIIFWKCIICLSSFRTLESIDILNKIISSNKSDLIKCEAERSIRLIRERYNKTR